MFNGSKMKKDADKDSRWGNIISSKNYSAEKETRLLSKDEVSLEGSP